MSRLISKVKSRNLYLPWLDLYKEWKSVRLEHLTGIHLMQPSLSKALLTQTLLRVPIDFTQKCPDSKKNFDYKYLLHKYSPIPPTVNVVFTTSMQDFI